MIVAMNLKKNAKKTLNFNIWNIEFEDLTGITALKLEEPAKLIAVLYTNLKI